MLPNKAQWCKSFAVPRSNCDRVLLERRGQLRSRDRPSEQIPLDFVALVRAQNFS